MSRLAPIAAMLLAVGCSLTTVAAADDLVPPGASIELLYTQTAPIRGGLTKGIAAAPDGTMYFSEIPFGEDKGMNSHDRVFVFNRGERPVVIFDREGRFNGSWGENLFARPHGITIGPDGLVYCTDDLDHTVKIFTPAGEQVGILGTSGHASDTGATSGDFRTIRRAGPPFHYPTNLALSPDGSLYVADGYGNARVHRYSPDGTHVASWGEPGGAPGEFRVPHGIAVSPDGSVVVADRESSRLQFFNPEGLFLREWTDVARPCQVVVDAVGRVYVVVFECAGGSPKQGLAGTRSLMQATESVRFARGP